MMLSAKKLNELLATRQQLKTQLDVLADDLKTIDDTIKTFMEENDTEEYRAELFKVLFRPNDTIMSFNKDVFIEKYSLDEYNACKVETIKPYYRVLPLKQ